MPYRQSVRVRYGECDMQKVVFNAHYLAYIDDTVDQWFREALGSWEDIGFDFMVKRIELEWHTPARFADVIELQASVARWGTTSFDVDVQAAVGERPVLSARVVYISTVPGAPTPTPVPDQVREALSRV